MLGCRFSFEADAKNVREKAFQCSLKTTEVLFYPDGHVLIKFDIYQGTVAPNFFKSHTNSWYPDFFQEKVLSDVRSEIHVGRRDMVSTGQSVRTLKICSGLLVWQKWKKITVFGFLIQIFTLSFHYTGLFFTPF